MGQDGRIRIDTRTPARGSAGEGRGRPSRRSLSDGTRARALGRACAASALLAAVAAPALVPAPAVAAEAVAPAPAARRTYDIPAGPLEATLNRFGREAGILLSFPTRMAAGLRSRGLSGSYGVQEALSRLLEGTGLAAVAQADGSYTLIEQPQPAPAAKPAAAERETTLPPVRATATVQRETATGHVSGYVAKRSATGIKTDTPIIEIPQSISVITADELEARAVGNAKEAVGYTAGVTPSASFDLREDLMTFRGFPFDWASFYLDGLAMPSTTYAISTGEPYGMERIEILRGPSSMLYGQNSAGGILDMVSKRPPDLPLRELQVQLGSHGRRQLGLDVGGPLGAGGEWSYRLTGLVRRSDTEVDFVEDNRIYLAPALTWKPSAATSLTLLANAMDDDLGHSGGTAAFLPASGIALPNPNGRIARNTYGGEPGFDFYKKKQRSVGYEFQHRFDDTWQFTQTLRWRKVEVDYQTAYGLGLSPADPAQRTLDRGAFGSFGSTEALALDKRLQAAWRAGATEHTSLLGVDYRRTKLDEVRYFDFNAPGIDIFAPVYGAPFALPATPDTDQAIAMRQLGFYAQDQMKFAGRWLLTLGTRWDTARQETEDRLTPAVASLSEDKLTGRVGLTYLLDNGAAPYASIATSFTPTLDPNFYGSPFKARTGRQYEVGVKYQPPGSNSLYTAAVFDLTQRNVLTADPDQINHPFGQVQTGEYRSRGLELEARTQLTRSLGMIGAYTYLDAEVTRSNDGNVGNTPKGIPRHTVSLWLEYRARQGSLSGLGAGLGVRYVDERPSADTPGFYMLPAFAVLDAALSYDLGAWRFALNVANLTDKVIYDCWYERCWYGPGRSVRATATIRW